LVYFKTDKSERSPTINGGPKDIQTLGNTIMNKIIAFRVNDFTVRIHVIFVIIITGWWYGDIEGYREWR
jgi:hypothetical protein